MTHQKGLYSTAHEHDSCGTGFIVNIQGQKSRKIVEDALTILKNMMHRGACGCQNNNGDGAGILIQIPHSFLIKVCDFSLPEPGKYGVGLLFLPPGVQEANECQRIFESITSEMGAEVLGWREVPTNPTSIGPKAQALIPIFRQVFIGGFDEIDDKLVIERKLYIIRKKVEQAIQKSKITRISNFHVVSLSSLTLIYKGMLTSLQLDQMFLDLQDPDMISAMGMIHNRFSTNTFSSWSLAHPYRYITHNGEINTLRGNINWMRAREKLCRSEWTPELQSILPVIPEGASDSASFDAVLEFLYLSGRPLEHLLLMMIPEAWSKKKSLSPKLKAFYEFNSCLMEPWDGPACINFTNGEVIGAILDRNGLRPSRYYITKNGNAILASEVGVLDIPPEDILQKHRVGPGEIFLVDTKKGRIILDKEIKERFASEMPYQKWLDNNKLYLKDIPSHDTLPLSDSKMLLKKQQLFGYTQEEIRFFLYPMAKGKGDPVNSMGNDASLASLSNRPRMLYDYFKQLFAQVTNPSLDAIREDIVTQMEINLGKEGNLLKAGPESCQLIQIQSPILNNKELATLKNLDAPFLSCTLPILFPAQEGVKGLTEALEELFNRATKAIEKGCVFFFLSDRDASEELAPIPALLAVSGLHHHLIKKGKRTKTSLIVETAEARQVHHMCTLLGYGASAINPYLALETIQPMRGEDHYLKALNMGVLKVLSKMGISTIQSYIGAQVFEALGIHQDVIEKYFTYTPSHIGGINLEIITEEVLLRHKKAYNLRTYGAPALDIGGEIQWKRQGEFHLFNPETVYKLQHSTMSGQYKIFKEYTKKVDEQNEHLATLRGLFTMKWAKKPIPIEEVEPIETIMKRFSTGGMSYGAISQEVHETLSIAMNNIGGKSNSGEGGENPERYLPDSEGHLRRTNIHQVASGRFGVTSEYLVNCDAIQIKISQGSKPGEGGQLPGGKVYPWIAKVRNSTPGVELISPPPHHDIYSIEDLAQLIYDLKNSNPKAQIHVKLASETGVGTIAAGVAKSRADLILISGHDGGTGASPITSMLHAGTPWEIGLAETQQTLVLNGLRERVLIQVDGQMKTGRDVVIGALLGADEYGFGTAPLVVSGCIMMRVCHLNTCPVGIATQDPELRKKFKGQPKFVENFFRYIAEEVREYMSKLGFHTMDEMIGQVDRLGSKKGVDHWKARGLDFSLVLHKPDTKKNTKLYNTTLQNHFLENSLDIRKIIPQCQEAINNKTPIKLTFPITNRDRTVGTILGYNVTKKYGSEGLPEETIQINFFGSAGQSFAAFLPRGITLTLEGDANDYAGKGLSGGKIILYPPKNSTFKSHENVIAGNVVLYGATSGEAYFSGILGDRFCVRNSGVNAVVEGIGDHGCEYMTEGRVVILGKTKRNFAAGMSGGIAYVLDVDGDFKEKCNQTMIVFELLNETDIETIKKLVINHVQYTDSQVGKACLNEWKESLKKFVKVIPKDYKRALEVIANAKKSGANWEQAVMDELHG